VQSELVNSLTEYGIEKIDALTYVTLLKNGEIKISELAKIMNLDRGKLYRSVKKLQTLGMINSSFSNPIICSAKPPAEALENILYLKESEYLTLKNQSAQIIKDLSKITLTVSNFTASNLLIIQGRTNIYAKIEKLLDNAKNTVYIVTTETDLHRMYFTSIPSKIQQLCTKNIDVKIITEQNSEVDLQYIKRLNSKNIGFANLPSKGRIIVEKNSSLIMSGSGEKNSTSSTNLDSVLFTDSEEMVKNIFSLCDLIWHSAKKLTHVKSN